MSATSAAPELAAASARTERQWYLGGVAAAIAFWTRIPVGLVRFVIFLVAAKHVWAALGIYAAAALVVPHQGRWLPGPINALGAVRVAVLTGALALIPAFSLDTNGIFGEGPGLWIPVGGVVLAGVVALLTEPRVDPAAHDPAAGRRVVLSTLPAAAVALAVGLGVVLAPGLRSEVILGAGLVLAGGAVAALAERISVRAAVVPLMLLGVLAIALAFAGARLEGGIGDLRAAPRSADAVAPVYRRAIGEVTLDLRHLPVTPGVTRTVRVSVGLGGIRILVPGDATGTFEARIGEGGLNVPDLAPAGGMFVHRVVALTPVGPPPRDGGARFRITAQIGKGCVLVVVPGEQASC